MTLDTLDIKIAVSKVSRLYRFHIVARLKGLATGIDQAPTDARFAVHRALSGASECLPASERAKQPEKYVYTSNLLVRRDVFAAEAFDPGFSGWGWEDVEWAMRVSRRFEVVHIDNPATHLELTAEELTRLDG